MTILIPLGFVMLHDVKNAFIYTISFETYQNCVKWLDTRYCVYMYVCMYTYILSLKNRKVIDITYYYVRGGKKGGLG